MRPNPVVLFPHAGLSLPELGKILSLFHPLRVFLPWQMEPAEVLSQDPPAGCVEIHHPPAELDPGASFRRAVADYRDWVRLHPDRSDLLKTGTGSSEEDPIWEIRRRIRERKIPAEEGGGGESFQWHMVLHLAREIEEQRTEADRILDALKETRSPLEGLTDDPGEIRSLFEDLPGFDWTPETGRYDAMPIIRAWVGLFGALLGPGDPLVSLDRRFVDLLTGLWTEAADPPVTAPPAIRFPYPDLSGHSLDRILEIRAEHFPENAARELSAILFEPGKASGVDTEALSRRAAGLTDFCPEGLRSGWVNLTSVFLPHRPELRGGNPDTLPPAVLLDRPLIFLEDAP
ncbi:MAG: hypothetical protein K9M82_05480 [Deltaproteobacteria bacterium]|nr:hypothetical protein [Deltaproteobacteria bacterium]